MTKLSERRNPRVFDDLLSISSIFPFLDHTTHITFSSPRRDIKPVDIPIHHHLSSIILFPLAFQRIQCIEDNERGATVYSAVRNGRRKV